MSYRSHSTIVETQSSRTAIQKLKKNMLTDYFIDDCLKTTPLDISLSFKILFDKAYVKPEAFGWVLNWIWDLLKR